MFNKEVEALIQDINPAEVFREILKQESGKRADSEALRDAYTLAMAERIRERMPHAELSEIDFDSFFECAIDSAYPVHLQKEDGDYFASAIDVPERVSEVCDELTANQKQALALHCLKTAVTKEAVEIECEGKTYKATALAAETPRKGKSHNAVKKFFAAALIAASALLGSVANAENMLGTALFKTNVGASFQQQLLRGQNDPAFAKSAVLKKHIASFRGKPLIEQLQGVHAFWNKFGYKSDQKSYGKADYWATTSEFLSKKGGDCEDYALVKYWSLRALGVPSERMRILVGRRIREDQSHAVLAVKDDSGKVWILDNLEKGIVSEKDMYLKFAPKVVVSETEMKSCLATPQLAADLEGKNPFEKPAAEPAAMTVSMAQGM